MHWEKKNVGLLSFFCIFCYTLVLYLYFSKVYSNATATLSTSVINFPFVSQRRTVPVLSTNERVLILYIWADTNVQSLGNLEFFIRYGVDAAQPADYYFILQKVDKKPVNESRLPVLPSNARYIQHENECYDIGTFGWFFRNKFVNTTLYKYFVFMNSSIRGPFLVTPLLFEGTWWFTLFIQRLNDRIKLVGPTINCEQTPHVQSYLMVTDQVGLSILQGNNSSVFRCHKNYHDAVFDGETTASRLILRSDYQIASLQTKYQGWDFRRAENQKCNFATNPVYLDRAIDGISHDPYELIFVKFKNRHTDLERRAAVYQQWLDENRKKKENL